jgi:hypothetical protein
MPAESVDVCENERVPTGSVIPKKSMRTEGRALTFPQPMFWQTW